MRFSVIGRVSRIQSSRSGCGDSARSSLFLSPFGVFARLPPRGATVAMSAGGDCPPSRVRDAATVSRRGVARDRGELELRDLRRPVVYTSVTQWRRPVASFLPQLKD